jgi:hypothetical protein
VTYRAELSERVLRQLGGFPAKALDALISTMSVTYIVNDARKTVTLTDVTWTG